MGQDPVASGAYHRPSGKFFKHLLAIGFFIVASAVMTFPLVLHMSDTIENWGDPLLNAWIMAWDVHQGLSNPLRLYDANIFYPYSNTLAYSESLIASALLVAPINLLTGNAVLAYNVLVLVSFVISGFAGYLLVEDITGSATGGLVSGFAFAFSLYHFGEFSHVQLLTAQWMPLVILFLGRYLRHGSLRSGLAFALFFALQALSSFYYAFFIALASLLYVALFAAKWLFLRVKPPRNILLKSTLLLALVTAIVLPPSLPYFSVQRELGMQRTLEDTFAGSASLENYLAVPANSLYSRIAVPIVSKAKTEETLFPGLITLGLATLAILHRRRKGIAIYYLATLVIAAFVLSLGPNLRLTIKGDPISWLTLPYGVLHEHLPGFQAMRVPARLAILVSLGLAGLAGIAAVRLRGLAPVRWKKVVVPLVILVMGLESLSVPVRITPIEVGSRVPEVYRWLAERPDNGVIFEYPTVQSRWLLYDEEMGRLGRYQYLSTYHWHPTVTGYSGFFPPLFWDIQRETSSFPSNTAISLLRGLDVKYLILHGSAMGTEALGEMERRLALFPELEPVAKFGQDRVFQLRQGEERGVLEVDIYAPPTSNGDHYYAYLRILNPNDAARIDKMPPRWEIEASWTAQSGSVLVQRFTVDLPTYFPKGLTIVPVAFPLLDSGQYRIHLQVNGSPDSIDAKGIVEIADARPALLAEPKPTGEVDTLQVNSVSVAAETYRPGDIVPVRLQLQLPQPVNADYTVYVKLLDTDGKVVAAIDSQPFGSHFPTSRWRQGAAVDDLYALALPLDASPGRYRLMVGAYNLADMSIARLIDASGRVFETVIGGTVRVAMRDGRLSVPPTNIVPVEGILAGKIALRGLEIERSRLRPGDKLALKLYWEALVGIDVDYTGFVHLVDDTGRPVSQSDAQPGNGRFATSIWRVGDQIMDERHIDLPQNLAPGRYYLKAGMYLLPGPEPLPVQTRNERDDAHRLYIGEVEIQP